MFFDISFKPELCASDDPTLSNLQSVELMRESHNGKETHWLVATDGYTLAKVPVSGAEGDALGPIQSEALEQARKIARKAKSGVGEIRCGVDLLTFADGSTMPRARRPENTSFPAYQHLIPPPPDFRHLDKALFEASKENPDPGPYVLKLGLDAELLTQAVKALGRKGVVEIHVTIQPPTVEEKDTCEVTGPLVLRAHDGTLAVVMPGRV